MKKAGIPSMSRGGDKGSQRKGAARVSAANRRRPRVDGLRLALLHRTGRRVSAEPLGGWPRRVRGCGRAQRFRRPPSPRPAARVSVSVRVWCKCVCVRVCVCAGGDSVRLPPSLCLSWLALSCSGSSRALHLSILHLSFPPSPSLPFPSLPFWSRTPFALQLPPRGTASIHALAPTRQSRLLPGVATSQQRALRRVSARSNRPNAASQPSPARSQSPAVAVHRHHHHLFTAGSSGQVVDTRAAPSVSAPPSACRGRACLLPPPQHSGRPPLPQPPYCCVAP